ncbi:MAG: hypothetical protein JNL64_14575 [Blastocatellia bacterium]|nr:hypothetical protein [Blastocatellia bacterium]
MKAKNGEIEEVAFMLKGMINTITLGILLSIGCYSQTLPERECEVYGTIVGSRGQALEKMEVSLVYAGRTKLLEMFVPSATTGSDGRFRVSTDCVRNDSRFALFVLPDAKSGAPLLVNVPPTRYLINDKFVVRRIVNFSKSRSKSVGRLRVSNLFATVSINFKDVTIDSHQLFQTWIVLLNSNNVPVAEKSIGNLVNAGAGWYTGHFEFRIPKGRWRIKICPDPHCKGPTIGESELISVISDETSFTLRPSRLATRHTRPGDPVGTNTTGDYADNLEIGGQTCDHAILGVADFLLRSVLLIGSNILRMGLM